MFVHELRIPHKRGECNPQMVGNLRQSDGMDKMPLKQILAENIGKLRASTLRLGTYKKVEKASGIGASTIERAEKMQSAATVDTVDGIAAAFGIHPLRLLAPDMHIGPDAMPPNEGYIRIPLLNAPHGMGGNLAQVDHPEILQYVEVSEEWARKTLNSNFGHIKIVPAIGDSMAGTVEDGSVVFVDTSVRHFAGDGLYAIIWQGRLQIKRLQARHEEQKIKIISDNKLYDPDWATDDLIVSGRVMAAWNFRRF